MGSSLTKETFLFLFQSDIRTAALPLSLLLFFSWTLAAGDWMKEFSCVLAAV